ncbi:hypothetical protein SS7213T_03270, partial [Staphylococcus simiae CCM 7213 = CCUG 51256]
QHSVTLKKVNGLRKMRTNMGLSLAETRNRGRQGTQGIG